MSHVQTKHSDDDEDESGGEDETLNFGAPGGELVGELPLSSGSMGATAGATPPRDPRALLRMHLRLQRVSANVARVWIETDAGARVPVESSGLALACLSVPSRPRDPGGAIDVPAHNGEWLVSYLAAYTLRRLAFASVDDELLLAIEPVRSVRVRRLFFA